MPFAVMWMDLGIVRLSEVRERERQILYGIIYMQNLKKIVTNQQLLNIGFNCEAPPIHRFFSYILHVLENILETC